MSTRQPADLVAQLASLLGWSVVAYLAASDSTDPVRAWAAGAPVPKAALERLRVAHAVVETAVELSDPGTARAWFCGLNERLGDRSPATIIREGLVPDDEDSMLWTARSDLG